MPYLNVEISEEAMRSAKVSAASAGSSLRKWIERLILDAAKADSALRERTYEPMGDA